MCLFSNVILGGKYMSFITVKDLNKTFKVLQRDAGLLNAFKSLFKRKYKYVNAVNNISFDINEGEIVAYIGPNGAGKSTTIKMLCGILYPDNGTILIDGLNPFSNRKRFVSTIGVVFGQKSQLWWDIPVEESFILLKNIYHNYRYHESDHSRNDSKKHLLIRSFPLFSRRLDFIQGFSFQKGGDFSVGLSI